MMGRVRTSVVTLEAFASNDLDMAAMAYWRCRDSACISTPKLSVASVLALFARSWRSNPDMVLVGRSMTTSDAYHPQLPSSAHGFAVLSRRSTLTGTL